MICIVMQWIQNAVRIQNSKGMQAAVGTKIAEGTKGAGITGTVQTEIAAGRTRLPAAAAAHKALRAREGHKAPKAR